MCGICGVFASGDGGAVQRMLTTLVHRGPDDELVVSGDDFALGARRLSIIDVSGGRQPVSNESGAIWAAQNGELYNFPSLRPRLVERGHQLHTRCDTELLPHLYEEHGFDLPLHIDGMFAVAVWDGVRKAGLLARDRMGKKPLYYWQRPGDGALYFASEIKALLQVEGVSRQIDREALHHFLSYKHVPHPRSIFEAIRIVPPGHLLTFSKGRIDVRPYWSPDFGGHDDLLDESEEELVDRFLHLFRRGVERRLMSDVPIGFFLSGGIDSSLATAIAAELSTTPIKTFTLTYDDGSTTEGKELDRRWARWVARKYATESYEEAIGAFSFPDAVRSVIRCFDEPFAGVISTYFLSALIAKHVKVAVSGDGADELFGSYLSHRLAGPVARYREYERTGDVHLIAPFQNERGRVADFAECEEWCWRSRLLVFSEEEKRRLYSSAVAREMAEFSTPQHLRATFESLTAREPLNRMLEAEFRTIFPDQVLTFVDRLSMAHSLEVRSPYLDTDVVNFVTALPDRMKIRNGDTKYLLKRAALRFFPREMVYRPKEGFFMPVSDWLRTNLETYVREVLSPSRLERHGLFDAAEVQRLVDELYSGGNDYRHANKVLSLLMFQEWHEAYAE